jgi:hypothetical protein
MRVTVTIEGNHVVLTPEEANQIASILYGKEMIYAKYVGSKRPAGATTDYVDLLQPFNVRSALSMRPLVDEEYDAIKFFTKTFNES